MNKQNSSLNITVIAIAITAIFSLLVILLAMSQKNANNSDTTDNTAGTVEAAETQSTNQHAVIKTAKGDIVIELRADKAPQTAANFVKLAQEGFYDNLTFHRREEGFVIQGGDPDGDGTGGPGYTVPAEINELEHIRGAVAMARLADSVNPSKASSGSQFYITLDAAHFLDNEYTVFGNVVEGMEVADQIQVGDIINTIEIR
jgi:cyclophilin family peptidyl-prolyl cis-trans isomerase